MCLEGVDVRGLHHRKSHFGISMLPSAQVSRQASSLICEKSLEFRSQLTSAIVFPYLTPLYLPPSFSQPSYKLARSTSVGEGLRH